MASNTSIDSLDSDVFFVEQISNEPSPQRNNSPKILNSTQLSQTHRAGMPSVSSIASPEPQILTINDNSNEPTMPYGFGRQLPIVPPNLNDLNLPPNPINILATMELVNQTEDGNDDHYSPQSPESSEPSPEPSEPSPTSTPPTHFRQLGDVLHDNRWKHVLLRWWSPENIFFAINSHPIAAAPKAEKKIEPGNVLSKKKRSVAAHLRSLPTENPLSKGHPSTIK